MLTLHSENLRRINTNPEDQTAPHRPTDFPDVFPAQATEQDLRDHVWWWRYQDTPDRARKIFPPWEGEQHQSTRVMLELLRNYHEPSAWFYEFRARYKGRYAWDFGRPWIRCTDEQWNTLETLVPSTRPAQVPMGLQRAEDCWVTLEMWVNLRLNDATLVQSFCQRIADARRLQNIKPPGKRGGVRRRKQSWLAIEAMDVQHYRIRALTKGESGQLSKHRARYEEICERLNLKP